MAPPFGGTRRAAGPQLLLALVLAASAAPGAPWQLQQQQQQQGEGASADGSQPRDPSVPVYIRLPPSLADWRLPALAALGPSSPVFWDRTFLLRAAADSDYEQLRPFLDRLNRGDRVVVALLGSDVAAGEPCCARLLACTRCLLSRSVTWECQKCAPRDVAASWHAPCQCVHALNTGGE